MKSKNKANRIGWGLGEETYGWDELAEKLLEGTAIVGKEDARREGSKPLCRLRNFIMIENEKKCFF